jgi:hypothetical protein
LIDPARTISATCAVAASVTRSPSTKLQAQPVEHRADLGAAAVDDDDVDPARLEQDDVVGEVLRHRRVAHRVTAVLHDEGLPGIALEIRQRLDQRFGLRQRARVGRVVGHPRPITA